MSDIRMTWILRGVAFSIAMLLWMIAVTFVDVNLNYASRELTGYEFHNAIEAGCFWIAVSRTIWGWTKRKLWVGTQQPT